MGCLTILSIISVPELIAFKEGLNTGVAWLSSVRDTLVHLIEI